MPGMSGCYILSEELILHFISKVFQGYTIKTKSLLRVTRNADIDSDALYDEDLDYREFMAELMKERKKLAPVRLELSRNMDEEIVHTIRKYLNRLCHSRFRKNELYPQSCKPLAHRDL